MTSIELVKRERERIRFLLKSARPELAAALRTATMAWVPVLAIDEVEILKNSSVLYDEIIAHRLGLIPLRTDLKGLNLPEKCKCAGKGCGLCTVKYSLKAEGPGLVLASSLKPSDPEAKPVYPEMPIVKLLENQKLELIATAKLGFGTVHAKSSPCLTWYIQRPKCTVNNSHPQFEALSKKFPKKIFKEGKISKELIEENCLWDAVEGIAPELVDIEWEPDCFLFFIEPWGQLTSREIVVAALKGMAERLQELGQALAGVAEPGQTR